MSIQGNEYQQIFLHLRSLNFHFLDTWVLECVNYYKSVNPNIPLEVLKKEVEQQWLLVNLREIKVPSLPPDLKLKEKIILNGNYAVQVESMIDSSVSCYSQFKKMLKLDSEDIKITSKRAETKIKPKRCLTFVICDGVQEIKAMEYQIINKIKTDDPELLPGFKMVIKGPVECRKGMILLKDENVRVCGGEVDTLTVTNSLKNILMRRLEIDESEFSENPTPSPVEDNKENCENQLQAVTPSNRIQDECVQSLLSQNDDLFLSLPLESEILGGDKQHEKNLSDISQNEVIRNENISDWKDDELENQQKSYMSNSKKHVLPQEDMETPTVKRLSLDVEVENEPGPSNIQNQSDFDRDIFMDDFNKPCSDIPLNISRTKKPVQTTLSLYFKNNNLGMSGAARSSVDPRKTVYINSEPFIYFKNIVSIVLSEPRIFMFKAVILTLKKKITIENDKYNLKACVTDGSCSVDVEFCSEILEDLLGFSPCEMIEMLKVKQINTAVAQRIKESFSKAQEKLISLNCLMKIKFFPEGKSPVILSLAEVTAQHVQALRDRKL